MAKVEIILNGRPLTVSCADGQEGRLYQLAAHVDGQIAKLVAGGITGSDAHLLAMASLLITDELFDRMEEAGTARDRGGVAPRDDGAAIARVEQLSDRVEELALRLERAY
ncbi:cell division protein ZapA [uncultured Gammaproteobacteria bacterium]